MDKDHPKHQRIKEHLLREAERLKFTKEELLKLRAALESLSLEELVTQYLPEWEGDLYKHRPVPPREWVLAKEHMNLKGQIYPRWLDDFVELFEGDYDEAVITGAIGTGKSFFVGLCLTRFIYELSCYKDPQLALGLAEGSPIVIPNIALNFKTAKEIVFEYVQNYVRRSEYFRSEFSPSKDLTKELVFPNNIRVAPAASTQSGVIGLNVFAACLDEINFYPKIQNSTRSHGVNEEYDHAKVLWNAVIRRMHSRFETPGGKLPGILLLVSSAMYPDDFTLWRKRRAEEHNERVFYRRYSQWEPKYEGEYPGPTFQIALGNAAVRPRILRPPSHEDYDETLDNPEYHAGEGIEIIDVPEDHRGQFEADLDMAIRDVAGYPTLAKHPFFRDMQPWIRSFERAKARGVEHPWSKLTGVTLDDGSHWLRDKLDLTKRHMHHFAHIDLALTQDAAGVSIVRIDGVEQVDYLRYAENPVTGDIEEETVVEYAPKMTTVLQLQVVAAKGREIPIAKVRRIILDLVNWGVNIQKVTLDSYQSAETIQQLQQLNIDAERLSVDRTMDAYNSLKEALVEDRLDAYEYAQTHKEASEVERDLERGKIDHPPGGCFTGDTEVKLLDGTYSTLAELAEKGLQHEFWVYACQPDGTPVPALAYNAHKTGEQAQLVKVTLDNGESVRCTPDHLFMLRDGSYKEAQDLEQGNSLMPLYYRFRGRGLKGYERIYNNHTQQWEHTHAWVSRFFDFGIRGGNQEVIHHIDLCKRNNEPSNLERMDREMHACLHERLSKFATSPGAWKRRLAGVGFRVNAEKLLQLPLDKALNLTGMTKRAFRQAVRSYGFNPDAYNHKVQSVEWLEEREDVYDITVPYYHNFALAKGVFVHNSKDVLDSLSGAVQNAVVFAKANPGQIAVGAYTDDKPALDVPGALTFSDFGPEDEDWSWVLG